MTEGCMSFVDHTFNTVMSDGEKLTVLTNIEVKATTWFLRKPHFSIKQKHIILMAYNFSINVCAGLYESGSDYCQNLAFEKGEIKSLKQHCYKEKPFVLLLSISLYKEDSHMWRSPVFWKITLKLLMELAKH